MRRWTPQHARRTTRRADGLSGGRWMASNAMIIEHTRSCIMLIVLTQSIPSHEELFINPRRSASDEDGSACTINHITAVLRCSGTSWDFVLFFLSARVF
jgi:hypothetical protein